MSNSPLGTVAIIGVGMIGGSLGCALRAAGTTVIGCDTAPLDTALSVGAIDRAVPMAEAAQADMVVLSPPVGSMSAVAEALAPHLPATTIVTDTGSVKGPVVQALTPLFGPRYVPAHPIAGKEHSGAAAADATLYQGASCILTPDEQTDPDAIARVTTLWQQAGAHLVTMTAEDHDRVFAYVSHLPHVVAFALMQSVHNSRTERVDPASFAAGGLKDFTRVAASNPAIWRDILLVNRQALTAAIDDYIAELTRIKTAMKNGDGDTLLSTFATANTIRKKMVP